MKRCFQATEHTQRPVLPEKRVEEAIAALPRLPAWSFQALMQRRSLNGAGQSNLPTLNGWGFYQSSLSIQRQGTKRRQLQRDPSQSRFKEEHSRGSGSKQEGTYQRRPSVVQSVSNNHTQIQAEGYFTTRVPITCTDQGQLCFVSFTNILLKLFHLCHLLSQWLI